MSLLPEKLHSSAFMTSSSSSSSSSSFPSSSSSSSSFSAASFQPYRSTASTGSSLGGSPYPHPAMMPPPSPYTRMYPHANANIPPPLACRTGIRGGSMPTFLLSSVACNDGTLPVSRSTTHTCRPDDDTNNTTAATTTVTNNYNLQYRIFRPRSLSSLKAAPILVLHGGPSVPSDYLYPLVDVVPYRSMVYYDQIGCGRSDEPKDKECYSISNAIDDLEKLIKKLGIRRFHLYGQSFGGILAFEYLKRVAERKKTDDSDMDEDEGCLSVILSSTPTSVNLVEKTATDLIGVIKSEVEGEEGDDDEEDDDESRDKNNNEKILELFRQRHQCRTPSMPQPLSDAYAHAGTVWRGTTAIHDYVAKAPTYDASRMPSAMIMRGEHDFVTEECAKGWKNGSLFNHDYVREVVLAGCAHHGLLENPRLYGDVVESFFAEYD